MRYLSGLLAVAPVVLAYLEIPNPPTQSRYASGAVHMGIMGAKEAFWTTARDAGAFAAPHERIAAHVPCVNGKAGEFRCNNIDLHHFSSHAALGSRTGEGSSSWGWTSSTGREFAIIAQADGAAFAEVTALGQLDYLGRLPNTNGSSTSIWRELRVLDNLLVIGSEAARHHVQIFDLTKLLSITAAQKPKTFHPWTDLTGIFTGLPNGATHNIVINSDRKYAVAVGSTPRSNKFRGGLVFIDLKNPAKPTLAGYAAEDGYVHDAQCLLYKGPDSRYQGIDICYAYNEDTLTIYDVSNLAAPKIISRTSYVGAAYTHQGWVLDTQNQERFLFLVVDDEYDEYDGVGPAADGYPVTYIWDIKSLTAPKLTGYYKSKQYGIDHNQYIKNGRAYQSHYSAGLRILDISSIPSDPTGKGVKELAFFDVYPEDDKMAKQGSLEFVGSWSSYALFKSGWIIINTIERGVFVVKETV